MSTRPSIPTSWTFSSPDRRVAILVVSNILITTSFEIPDFIRYSQVSRNSARFICRAVECAIPATRPSSNFDSNQKVLKMYRQNVKTSNFFIQYSFAVFLLSFYLCCRRLRCAAVFTGEFSGDHHHRIQTGANYHARKHREGTDAPSTFTHLGLRGNSSI
ncbi:hypothetical protein LY78DRAFT_694539 [Colletotrichum sublineola]|uniref:Putative zinc metalloprotease mde10 n=1 Tax=Colletotrichum sublineola TaxID=1173701 RepID=A0A066XI62_COLSU|nr:hypothetical protein LY78DRAFT_694539 [Colletotrichum sublineola]KDN65451.1 putative zinc metalloprotease mde10 [Colletotrichum sublineola]